MSTPSRRRNRSLASCEPCRKGKIRCDHQKPVCGGCRRRGWQSRCWYHPAPLTRHHAPTLPPVLNPTQPIANPLETHAFRVVPQASETTSANRTDIESIRLATFTAWPFANFQDVKSHPSLMNTECKLAQDENLATMMRIISRLSFLPTIEKLTQDYYSHSQAPLVAKTIVVQLIASVKHDLISSGYAKQGETGKLELENTTELAGNILRASSLEVPIESSLDVQGFCALFTGSNLRVETVGLLYTVAARSVLYFSRQYDQIEDDLMQDMAWYSNSCLRLARELSPQTTDVMIWLAQENLQITSVIEGNASRIGWRLVGDLSTDIFALGLNREITYSSKAIPFFLAECRRKTYATAYYLDKIFAMVLNRPPRISARHADCRMPLDLSTKDIFVSSDEDIQKSHSKVTSGGWGMDLKHRSTTWARLRCILAVFREEMIEYQISSVRPVDELKLRDSLKRCDQTWDSLPPHVKYNADSWDSTVPTSVCFMLGKIYLSYLHIKFYIHRLLGEGSKDHLPALLELSYSILETVIQITNSRNKTPLTLRDLPEMVLSYGLPCAFVLITALENTSRDPVQPLPASLKPSSLIRNLSVLVAHLENISQPNETNHTFCIQASRSLSRKLDHILDSIAEPNAIGTTIVHPPAMGHDTPNSHFTPHNASSLSPLGDDTVTETRDFENIDLSDLDNFDLSTWVIDVDLDAACEECNAD